MIINKLALKVTRIVRLFYTWLIVITLSSMFLYCLLDFLKKLKEEERGRTIHLVGEKRPNLKFNKIERSIHLIHILSFVLLVWTGFAHRFPESFFFSPLLKLIGAETRGILHRVSGSILVALFLLHLFLIVSSERGRKQFLFLLPKRKDLEDAVRLLLFNLGIKREIPLFSHPFTFYEKFEYWAFVWGTLIMSITGVALWLNSVILDFVPKWIFDLFLLVHFYEAVLASLAILIWHFYWNIFDPLVYPINPLMFSKVVPPTIS